MRIESLLLLAALHCSVLADFYSDLGITKAATQDDVKKAYRKLAVTLHPDKNPSPDAADNFSKLTHAYEILSDAEKRQVCDQQSNEF